MLIVKKMNLYVSIGSKEKILKRGVEINKKGKIDKLMLSDRAGKISRSIQYIYENDILKKQLMVKTKQQYLVMMMIK